MSRSGCGPANHVGQGLAQLLSANANANSPVKPNGADSLPSPGRNAVAPVKPPKAVAAGEAKADAVSDAAVPNPTVAAASPAPAPAAQAATNKLKQMKKHKSAKKALPFPALSPAPTAAAAPAPSPSATPAPAAAAAADVKSPAAAPARAPRKQQSAEEAEAEGVQAVNTVDYSTAHEVLIKDVYMAKLLAVINAELKRLTASQTASNHTIAALHHAFDKLLATPNLMPEMLIPELKAQVNRALDAANAFVLARGAEGANTTDVTDALPAAAPASAGAAAADAKGAADAKVQHTDGTGVGGDDLPFGSYPALHMNTEALSRPDGVKSAVQVLAILAEVKELTANPKGEFYETARQLYDPLQALVGLLSDNALAPMDSQAAAVIGVIQQYVRDLMASALRLVFRDARAECTRLKAHADAAYDEYIKEEKSYADQLALGDAMCKHAIVAMGKNKALRAVGKSKDHAELVMTDKLGAATAAARRKWDECDQLLKAYARQHEHDTVAVATRHGSTAVLIKARAERTARLLAQTIAERDRLAADAPTALWTSPAGAMAEVERQRCLHGAQQAIERLRICQKAEEIALQLNDARLVGQKQMLTRAGEWVLKAQAAWNFVRLAVEIAQDGIQKELDKRMEQLTRDTVELEAEFVALHQRVYIVFNRRRIQMKNALSDLAIEKDGATRIMRRAMMTGKVKEVDAQNRRITEMESERKAAEEELKSRTAMLAELDAEPELNVMLQRTRQQHPRDIPTGIPDLTDDALLLEAPPQAANANAAPAAAAGAGAAAAAAAAPATPAKPTAAVAMAMAGGPPAAASPAHALPPAANAGAGASAGGQQTEGDIGGSAVLVMD